MHDFRKWSALIAFNDEVRAESAINWMNLFIMNEKKG